MNYEKYTLPNGLRLIHHNVKSPIAYCGIFISTGSRDEKESEHGMAHFIEHVLFKGTTKRKPYQLINTIENLGGELDAYTSKEKTVIYSVFLNKYYPKAMDVLSDIFINSTFPEKELIKEKDVIIDEINSYKDSPSEQIFDDFEELVYKNHPIGRNILGTPESLKSFNRNDILNFIQSNYHTDNVVFCSVGDIKFDKIKQLFDKFFRSIKPNFRTENREKFDIYIPERKIIETDNFQAHCVIGNLAYSLKDEKRTTLSLLNNILGGPSMNSRLNMMLREKHGFAYTVESSFNAYSDTGLFNIYFGSDKSNIDRSIQLIMKELKKLKTQKLRNSQLHIAKKQIEGQIAISADSKSNRMFTIGESFLFYDEVDSIKTLFERIEKITASEILEIANEIFQEDKLSTLIYK
jgi:predicted Zn-dependent peptidase